MQVTLSAYTDAATINPYLSAFGPNQAGNYDSITFKTTQANLTAFIIGYSFANPQPYYSEPAIWTLSTTVLSAASIAVNSAGFTLALSGFTAAVYTGALGPQTATLTLNLSATCLSGIAAGSTAVVDLSSQTQNLTFSLTAVNLPVNGVLNADTFRRNYLLGLC